jgi:thymidine phosphorylase
MEMLAPVNLGLEAMRRVVEKTGGCIVWGGGVNFSPADDVLIRIERALDVDGEGQLVASVLSKKIAAGSTHVLIDIPVGPSAKVRSQQEADSLSMLIQRVGAGLGLHVRTVLSDGMAPVGRGIGPALEARDVMAVLGRDSTAPADLRERSLQLTAQLIELAGFGTSPADAITLARRTLESGKALAQFLAICEAQGGLRSPGVAAFQHPVTAKVEGNVTCIDNRRLAQAAKLAGAPQSPLAGLTLDVPLGARATKGQPLFTLHAQTRGELAYALEFVSRHPSIVEVTPP